MIQTISTFVLPPSRYSVADQNKINKLVYKLSWWDHNSSFYCCGSMVCCGIPELKWTKYEGQILHLSAFPVCLDCGNELLFARIQNYRQQFVSKWRKMITNFPVLGQNMKNTVASGAEPSTFSSLNDNPEVSTLVKIEHMNYLSICCGNKEHHHWKADKKH